MDINLIKITYYVDGYKDTFYEVDLYKYYLLRSMLKNYQLLG